MVPALAAAHPPASAASAQAAASKHGKWKRSGLPKASATATPAHAAAYADKAARSRRDGIKTAETAMDIKDVEAAAEGQTGTHT